MAVRGASCSGWNPGLIDCRGAFVLLILVAENAIVDEAIAIGWLIEYAILKVGLSPAAGCELWNR
jgi:hypothetical protein